MTMCENFVELKVNFSIVRQEQGAYIWIVL